MRNGPRAGVESYSIKNLEPIYGFERDSLRGLDGIIPKGLETYTVISMSSGLRAEMMSAFQWSAASKQNGSDDWVAPTWTDPARHGKIAVFKSLRQIPMKLNARSIKTYGVVNGSQLPCEM